MSRGLAAVVFDFDGLLADTETIHTRTWIRTLAEAGVTVSVAEYGDHWIRRGLGIPEFVAARALPLDVADLLARKQAHYFAEIDRGLDAMPGAHGLLDRLRGRVPLALVTSGRRAMVDAALRRLGMDGRFDVSLSYESVTHRKPHPEPFARAAEALGVPASRCVALEDAEKGVLSAAAAGMPVVAVPNEQTRDHDFSRAALVVPSLDAVDYEVLASLVG